MVIIAITSTDDQTIQSTGFVLFRKKSLLLLNTFI